MVARNPFHVQSSQVVADFDRLGNGCGLAENDQKMAAITPRNDEFKTTPIYLSLVTRCLEVLGDG